MKKILYILVLLATFGSLSAQSDVRFEEVNSINSLSHNGVTYIHQDKLGFLWIGTFNGLNKYDGYSFRVFKFNENSEEKVSTSRIISIHEDKFGRLWIMTYDGWFHRFDPATESYRNFPDPSDSSGNIQFSGLYESESGVIALYSDKWGVMFVTDNEYEEEYKVYHYFQNEETLANQDLNNVSFVVQDANKDFWIGTEGGLLRINESEIGISEPELVPVERIESDKSTGFIEFTKASLYKNQLWMGTKNNGLVVYDPEHKDFIDLTVHKAINKCNSCEITALNATNDYLWIGTAGGRLGRYDGERDQLDVFEINNPEAGRIIEKLYPDKFGQLWLITENFGITRFDPTRSTFRHYRLTPRELSNLTDDERISIFEDSRNQFWLGGQNMGIQRYDRATDAFTRYINDPRDPYSLQSNVVECIMEDRDGNIWVGTNWFGKGLSRMIILDPAFQYIRPVKYPDYKVENVIRSIFVDSRGYTWTGTKNGHIHIYNPDLRPVYSIGKSSQNNYSGYNVYSIYEDRSGYIWLSTKGAGIYKSDQSLKNKSLSYSSLSFSNIRNKEGDINSLSNDNVYDLIVDDMDRVWVATYGGGLNMIEQDNNGSYRFHHFNTENSSLSSDKIRDLYIDSRGRLWLGTTYGLNYLDIYSNGIKGSDFKPVLSNQEIGFNLAYNDIIMVIEDSNGHIWVGTSGGGAGEIINPGSEKFDINNYNSEGGLNDDYVLSLAEDIYGFIWIGTNSGLSRYNPVNREIKNFDNQIGLSENYFSERTATTSPSGNVLFGTINGFYAIDSDRITETNIKPVICLTGLEINNTDVHVTEDSPLQRTISYTDKLRLRYDESNFAVEFSMLLFNAPENKHYRYMLEEFDDDWVYIGTERKATFTNIPPGNYTFRVQGLNSDRSEYGTEASLEIAILPPIWRTKLAYFIYFLLVVGTVYLGIRISLRFFRLKNEVKIEKRVAESKLRFFTNISHEIRTPLTLILGPLKKLLVNESISSDVRQQLSVIHRNSNRLLRMVNQILDFRKVQNEQMQLKIQEIEVIPFLKQIYESFENLAKQKNVRFQLVHDHRDEDLVIWGDIQKLDIVFFNLLSNAFKFTPENGQISIIVSFEDVPDDAVKIIVRDTGVGIEKDKLDLIFDRFFVSHTGKEDEFQGTGIGLSLSLEYVKLHKGEMKAESEIGKGTDFTVQLFTGRDHFPETAVLKQRDAYSYTPKVPPVQEPVEEVSMHTDPVERSLGGNYHILVVEDDIEMCSYLNELLNKEYRVSIAKNGQEGWDKALDLIPDLIITDNMMPVMNGIEFTKLVKDEFSTCHIPVIILSSKSEVESQVEGLQTGAEAYIPKPFNDELLISYIQSFINQREKIKEIFNSRIELKPDEVQVNSRDKEFINEVIKMIDDNMADPEFNVEKLAEKVFISRTMFYKKIKGITGYQPVELIRMLRLKKAAQYIETGEYNISEVAYMVGYNDTRYFSTSFKKQFGVSPSKYTKNSGLTE